MNLTAATITVYFMGLINFHGEARRDVIVPLTPDGKVYRMKTLEPHHAEVVIEGLTAGSTGCTDLEGTWVDPPGPPPPTCTVNVSRKRITLPSSSAGFTTTDNVKRLPKLTRLCSGLGDLSAADVADATKHAAVLTLAGGELDSCLYGDAWVSSLTLPLTGTTGTLSIGTKSASLDDKAIVKIKNTPAGTGGTHEQHFWWYYVLYKDTGTCGAPAGLGLPEPDDQDPIDCTGAVLAVIQELDAASGVGCSNTGYP